ncbi:hypothetical protein RDI58_027188 [Solanum bulbocastanum]|uniref:Uncharacterized protein n=1 Tax=Solanum bulbocastanum TaxID=147425 RepID=A0AAN8Y256_SOLBU
MRSDRMEDRNATVIQDSIKLSEMFKGNLCSYSDPSLRFPIFRLLECTILRLLKGCSFPVKVLITRRSDPLDNSTK